jgi:hypothetical protein
MIFGINVIYNYWKFHKDKVMFGNELTTLFMLLILGMESQSIPLLVYSSKTCSSEIGAGEESNDTLAENF